MSKHSISPWIVEVDPVHVGPGGDRYQAVWMWASGKKSIIFQDTFHPDADTRETEIADIRLIAAAPELLGLWHENDEEVDYGRLQWLESLLNMISANFVAASDCIAGGDFDALNMCVAELRLMCADTHAAIHKAEGGEG